MGNRQAVINKRHRAIAVVGAALLFAGLTWTAASASATATFTPIFAPAPGSDLPSKEATGTNAGLSPRLAALAGGLAEKSKTAQSTDLSLAAHGAGSLQRDGNRYVVSARVDSTSADLLDALRGAGAQIVSVNGDDGTVDVSVAAEDLVAVARVPGVESVTEDLSPIVGHVGHPGLVSGSSSAAGRRQSFPCQGVNISEGDTQMNAAGARATYGLSGVGQTVGVISNSFDTGEKSPTRAAQDVASGDLPGTGNPCNPTPVAVLADGAPTDDDEGRAMAQIVHDLAPGAALQFASSGASADAMANSVRALQTAGSSVIVDDVTYFDEPFFQEGSVSEAVDQVTAAGIPYYSSAANSNVIVNGRDVGSFETPALRPGGQCINGAGFAGSSCMDFGPVGAPDPTFDLLVNPGASLQINLQWAQPRNGVTTDLDMFAVIGNTIVGQAVTDNVQAQKPFELLNLQNSSDSAQDVGIIVNRSANTPSGTPRFKFILGRPTLGNIQTPRSGDILGPTIFGHNGAPNAVSTAAIPYNNAATPETYSSRGPVTYYFGPDNGTTAAAALGTPQVLNKPDLAATDDVQTTFFADNSSGVYRFAGTSAAAPHAAAVAALQKQANPLLNVSQVVGAQEASAVPVGGFTHTAVGAGLVNAGAAVAMNPPIAPETTITQKPKNKVRGKRVTYDFSANLPGVSFVCKLDRSKPVLCAPPVKVVHLDYGKHKFQVAAVNGNAPDPSPATDKFKRKPRSGRHL